MLIRSSLILLLLTVVIISISYYVIVAADSINNNTPTYQNTLGVLSTRLHLVDSPPTGLLDPLKFSMSQRLIISYAYSSNKSSKYRGVYLNTLKYQFTPNLMVKLHTGYEYQPLRSFNNSQMNNRLIFPALELHYRPSKNFIIHLRMENNNQHLLFPTEDNTLNPWKKTIP